MGKRGRTEEEILRVLREAEAGWTVVEVCRKYGISQQSFYLWKRKYAGLGLNELRELRQLREENNKLKRLSLTSASMHGFRRTTARRWPVDPGANSRRSIHPNSEPWAGTCCDRSTGLEIYSLLNCSNGTSAGFV